MVEKGRDIEPVRRLNMEPFKIPAAGQLKHSPPLEPLGSRGKYHAKQESGEDFLISANEN
jgi:hypothetical protein